MCIDVTTFLSSVTTIATVVTTGATVVLALYNNKLLSRIDKQHQTDIFFRAFPYRKIAYESIKQNYDTIIDKEEPKIWDYGNLRGKSSDEINNLSKHQTVIDILSSLDKAKSVFTNERVTNDIPTLINDTIAAIDEHDSKLRKLANTENIQPQEDEIKDKCKDTHEKLKSSYKNLVKRVEEFLTFYNIDLIER